MGRAVTVARIEVQDRDELKEIQSAAKERVAALEKLEKQLSDRELHSAARDVAAVLRTWKGVDGEAGLLDRIDDQMSLYEPAFSSNGREPDGQRSIFEGVDPDRSEKPAEAVKAVDHVALRAALILSDLMIEAGPEAFDKLDEDVPAAKRLVYIGRAPMELLREMNQVDALAVYQIVLAMAIGDRAEEDLDPDDDAVLGKLATAIASHGATAAPFHDFYPVDVPGLDLVGPREIPEEDWPRLATEQLQYIVQAAEVESLRSILAHVVSERAAHGIDSSDLLNLSVDHFSQLYVYALRVQRATHDKDVDVPQRPAFLDQLEEQWAAANPPPYQPSAAEKIQEEALTQTPVSDPFFKDALKQGTVWSLTRSLEIVAGLEGQKTREKLIRKRLKEIAPESLAEIDGATSSPDEADDEAPEELDPQTLAEVGTEDRLPTDEEREEADANARINARTAPAGADSDDLIDF